MVRYSGKDSATRLYCVRANTPNALAIEPNKYVCHVSSLGICQECRSVGKAPMKSIVTVAMIASRSEEHTSELQSLMRISYAVFCLKQKNQHQTQPTPPP